MHNHDLAGRHFTTSAIHIVEQVWPRAADRCMSSEVTAQTTPMLGLWSLLRWERQVGVVVLERLGVEVDALARDVDRALDAVCTEARRQKGPPRLHILLSGHRMVAVNITAPLETLLGAAEHEALGLGHNWVGSEHLLLAIVRLADPRLRELLDHHRVVYDGVRQAVRDFLHA